MNPAKPDLVRRKQFLGMIFWANLLGWLILGGLAWVWEAKLGLPAQPTRAPNPAKSAWFLVWVQEWVSYSKSWITLLVVGFIAFLFLPQWASSQRLRQDSQSASVFCRNFKWIHFLVLGVLSFILILTGIGLFLRGENWQWI